MSHFVEAKTEYGIVQGIEKSTVLNESYISFTGIPYATPPLGSLRFKVNNQKKSLSYRTHFNFMEY
jgi:carboxylesterase type B